MKKQSVTPGAGYKLACLGLLVGTVMSACSSRSQKATDESVAQAVQQTVKSAVSQPEGAKGAEPGSAGVGKESCTQCEERACRDFRGLQIDLVAGCYHDSDPAKVKACTQAVECGRHTKCGFTLRGPEECYCGTATADNCAKGESINGPCRAQFEAAAGTTDVKILTESFGDRKLALGNAVFMLQCDRDFCKEACTP